MYGGLWNICVMLVFGARFFCTSLRSRSCIMKVPAYLYHVWRTKCKTRRRKALFLGCLVVFLTAPIPINRRIARLPLWDRCVR